jgi:transposase
MTKYREILRLHSLGISQRDIAASCQCSTKTISKILKRAKELAIAWPLAEGATDEKLDEQFFPKQLVNSNRRYPDMEYIHKELARNGVSLKLLWNEYCEECRLNSEIPFMYTQFCYHYQKYAMSKNATMHMPRHPGNSVEVDWAGQSAQIIDRDTGDIINAYTFVGVLSYSQYAYIEACKNENLETWIAAHNHMYSFFGGVPRMTIPDNLRTGVSKAARHYEDPVLNKTYHEMAEHYNTAIVPARVRKPRDKPNAEDTVKLAGQWIIAALRNIKFFTLAELNRAIEHKLRNYNEKPFQQKPGCRSSVFLEEEQSFLAPLPSTQYEISQWKKATVGFNYHISVDRNYYSCPYEYIKCSVDVRLTNSIVEIFYKNHR